MTITELGPRLTPSSLPCNEKGLTSLRRPRKRPTGPSPTLAESFGFVMPSPQRYSATSLMLRQRSLPAQPKSDDSELTKWRGHCLRFEPNKINVGEKLYRPTRPPMVSMTLNLSVIACQRIGPDSSRQVLA